MEDEEYKKLPVDERCVHKLWKARVNGYEEVTKLFRQIDDEKSPEFAKYLGLVKKFVIDSNAMGQEKGLEAALAFVENYANAGKTVGEVMSGVVTKCIAAPKTKTRELALQLTLMYIEIEKQEAVVEELVKGTEQKNPKIVSACINAITTGLREFGSKVINVKPLVKKIPVLFADRDKNVRDESRLLVVEIYRWIGGALRSQLNNLQPVQVTELEAEFAKVDGKKAVPCRYLRSQQEKQAKLAEEAGDVEEGEDGEEDEEPVALDPYDIADPVEILSKLPKDFYDKVEMKKWQDRKEALETLEQLVKHPKLEPGDYGDLVRALKKMIQKDSNVIVVALAAKCLAGLASGLKKKFQPYSSVCVPVLLEKFKEKKQNVVTSLRDAIDAIYLSTTLENTLEDVLEALNNKNPSVKSETAMFLARSFTKTLPTVLNKKILKAVTGALIKLINEPDPSVRDSSAEALGTLMKLVGEKAVSPFLVELEKDALKMAKIRECCEKAVIAVKVPGAKKERPTTAPVKAAPAATKTDSSRSAPASAPKAAKRPATAVKKKAEISSGSATIVKSKGGKAKPPAKPIEKELSEEDVAEIVGEMLSAEILSGLSDANWKTRLSSVEQFMNHIQTMENPTMPTQALVRTVAKKPGLKDTNFQVLKGRLDIVKYLASNGNFSTTTASLCLNEVTEKLGDAKNGATAGETLTAIAEATSLAHVSATVMDFAFTQKSPKVLQETLLWMGNAIKDFGFGNLNAKMLIDCAKKALASNNPSVRSAAIVFFGILYLYMGPTIHMFLENEKQALRDQINVEFEKYENEKPPPPTRGVIKSASSNSIDAAEEDDDDGGGDAQSTIIDILPRTDINPQITEALITEMADKNWKIRNEALIKVSNILSEAKLIKPNIGDLPQALALRLVDSNSKIAQTALNICETIAVAMGPPCRQHVRTLFPGFLQGLGDSKAWIRSASVSCMNTFGEQGGFKEFFEGEVVGDALKGGSPTLRSELWAWLAEKLPTIKSVPKEELMVCIPYLYANLEDRSADVRKNAQEAVLGIMIHTGYESMAKQLEKLKPGSKAVVQAALEKARPNLPAKPAPAKKQASSPSRDDKAVKGTRSAPSAKTVVKPKGAASSAAVAKTTTARSKKEEDVDMSPLLCVNNMKHQRTIDESKLKVLKWNFTQPREEFVELLRDQMTNANVNKGLIGNMFHSDFKFHIKAIESLMEDLGENSQALISNLDLILKWLTLRFFDTNPSVLLKGLEYLHSVFNVLIENKYHMLENEAGSFIPYLLLKIGDPKDSVRNGVRSLLKQIYNVYSVSKLFTYIIEGLKSKNARQRAECLEMMGAIISDFGISVCLPTPAACLKEVVKQISDRDNSVRNAALNCSVQVYYIVGEKIYKMVGKISDKDMSLLEERIKRASKKPPPAKLGNTTMTQPMNTTITMSPQHNQQSPVKNNNTDDDMEEEKMDEEEEEDEHLPNMTLPSQVIQEPVEEINGPWSLDPDLIKELDSWTKVLSPPALQKFDLTFLWEEIVVPSWEDARAKVMPISPPKPILPTDSFTVSRQGTPKDNAELLIGKHLANMGSPDPAIAMEAIDKVQEILQSNKSSLMMNYEDTFMMAVVTQLRNLCGDNARENHAILKIYRNLLTIIDTFYSNKLLGRKVSVTVLKEVINQFIVLLVENKLDGCPNDDAYIRVINLHCVKIIENSDHTSIICALIQLLYSCILLDNSTRKTDLVMKCLWRVIKIMPSWADEIDYDSILLEIHSFLKDFPSATWKGKQGSDTPLRTIKTIIHSMAKIKGGALMLHLTKIPNTNDSEMEAYILRLLKSLKLEEVKQVPLKMSEGNVRRSLSRSTQNQLTDIFQKIGIKEETKEGLNKLYDFLQQNPEADIDPFLKKSSSFFQNYIQKSLKEIDIERKSNKTLMNTQVIGENLNERRTSASSEGQDYYNDRIKYWNERWDKVMK